MAKRGSVRHSGTATPSPLWTTAPAMPGAGREPHADDLGGAGAPGRLVDELAGRGSVSAIEAAAASNMPAAVRTIASITRRCTGARPRLWASERPPRSLIGTPIASAKASAEEIRISGSISRPPASASRSSGGSSGATLSIFSMSP